ncbi:hypothetical protein J6590_075480 [Homalodisca vitripennis]|nr:hypothetical protein J6590_075480 [Homalodisca vitripennis]
MDISPKSLINEGDQSAPYLHRAEFLKNSLANIENSLIENNPLEDILIMKKKTGNGIQNRINSSGKKSNSLKKSQTDCHNSKASQTLSKKLTSTATEPVTARVPVGCIGGVEVVKSAGSVMVTTNTKCRLNVGFYQGATPWRVTLVRDNTGI